MYYEIKNAEQFRKVKAEYLAAAEKDRKHRERGRTGWTPAAKQMVSAMGVLAAYAGKVARDGYPVEKCCEALDDQGLIREFAKHLYYQKGMRQAWFVALQHLEAE